MKVRELIKRLQELNQESDVYIEGYVIGEIELHNDVNGEMFYVISSKVDRY